MSENAYTKGTRTRMSDEQKDKIRAAQLRNRLLRYAKAKGKTVAKHRMEPAQVSAAKVLIDKWLPSLQSVEQKTINQWDNMTEEEMISMVRALITSHPQLLREFAPGPSLSNCPVAEQQVSDMPLNNVKEAA